MNPLAELLPALYKALANPAMTYDGQVVPVYQHLPGNSSGNYVLIEQPTDSDAPGARACDHFSCTVLLDVVTQFATDLVSTLPAEAIVSQIHERLRKQRLTLSDGWDCGPGSLEPGLQIKELDNEYHAVRRLLRYRWEIYYTPPISFAREERPRYGHETSTSYNPTSYA